MDVCLIKIIIHIKSNKDEQLNAKLHQIGYNNRQRHDDSWKIYLPENRCITCKRITGRRQTGAKIIPNGNPCQVKQERRYRTCFYIGHFIKNKCENQRCKQWLN